MPESVASEIPPDCQSVSAYCSTTQAEIKTDSAARYTHSTQMHTPTICRWGGVHHPVQHSSKLIVMLNRSCVVGRSYGAAYFIRHLNSQLLQSLLEEQHHCQPAADRRPPHRNLIPGLQEAGRRLLAAHCPTRNAKVHPGWSARSHRTPFG